MKLRAVLDTNVLVSGLGWPGPSADLIDLVLADRIELVVSEPLLDELFRVIAYPRLRHVFDTAGSGARELVGRIADAATMVSPTKRINMTRDPDDDKVLEAASAAHVDMIATGDADLLSIGSFEGISILSPRDALARALAS